MVPVSVDLAHVSRASRRGGRHAEECRGGDESHKRVQIGVNAVYPLLLYLLRPGLGIHLRGLSSTARASALMKKRDVVEQRMGLVGTSDMCRACAA